MAKGKEISSKPATFAKGGSGKMFGKQSAGPQKPGTTAHSVSGNGGKFAKGGPSGKVGNQKPSVTSKAGATVSN